MNSLRHDPHPIKALHRTRWFHGAPRIRSVPWLPSLVVGLAYFVINGWFNHRRLMFQCDSDEGYALIQALLVGRGHPLYLETYSDQPPGFTYLILAFTKLFGETPEAARLFTLLVVSGYLAALYDLCRRKTAGWGGHLGGLLACLSLALSHDFIRYSCAAMIGLPALCLGGLSALVLERSRGRWVGSAWAGLLLALSLGVKPFLLPLVPVFLFTVIWRGWRQSRHWPEALKLATPFFLAFLGSLLIEFLPVLFTPHGSIIYTAHRRHTVGAWPGWAEVQAFFWTDLWLLAPALLFGPLLWLRKNGSAVFAYVCLLIAVVSLSAHAPIWNHHRYLVLLPASALFGLGFSELISLSRRVNRPSLRVGAFLVIGSLLAYSLTHYPPSSASSIVSYFEHKPQSFRDQRLVDAIADLAPAAKLMATPSQMFAYRLGMEVPPELAMTSRKRFEHGDLDAKTLSKIVLRSDPDIIMLNDRWPPLARKRIEQGIESSHSRVLNRRKDFEIYIRHSLLSEAR